MLTYLTNVMFQEIQLSNLLKIFKFLNLFAAPPFELGDRGDDNDNALEYFSKSYLIITGIFLNRVLQN